jgi:activator of Hsp90 ATPase-like protein
VVGCHTREVGFTGEALNTAVFVEQGGKTTLTVTMRYESREARDVILKSPVEGGVAASYDKLAEVLASSELRARR